MMYKDRKIFCIFVPMKPTLLVLAAGMGSRYGSLKQMDGVGPSNEAILDYSVYDAIRAGFGRVVFVIRHDFAADFESVFNAERFGGRVEVAYVYQELDTLPEGFTVPDGRAKPWGTNHAVMMAKEVIHEPFAVINADDFYGADAFRTIGEYLHGLKGGFHKYCMVAYELSKTLSANGTVSRGVCTVDRDDNLTGIVERKHIERTEEGRIVDLQDDVEFSEDTPVSMNLFGFTPDYFLYSERSFRRFLEAHGGEEKSEFFIPLVVNELVNGGHAEMKVLHSSAQWFGVTYREDKPELVAAIRQMVDRGEYPENLWV